MPISKQEEIREGIKQIIKDGIDYPLRKYGEPFNDFYIDKLLSYLHSQGYVLKVDKGLPVLRLLNYFNKRVAAQAYRNAQNDMLKAGYVATIPIKVEE